MSFCLFISILCVKMFRVNKALNVKAKVNHKSVISNQGALSVCRLQALHLSNRLGVPPNSFITRYGCRKPKKLNKHCPKSMKTIFYTPIVFV